MAATARIDASIRRALIDLASDGVRSASSELVATRSGLKRRTVMRYGRESMPVGLDWWRASYRGGTFEIMPVQTGVVLL